MLPKPIKLIIFVGGENIRPKTGKPIHLCPHISLPMAAIQSKSSPSDRFFVSRYEHDGYSAIEIKIIWANQNWFFTRICG